MVKKDIVLLKHSERLKSGLIIGAKLISALENLKDEELEGGTKILSQFFKALSTEIGIAYNSTKDERFKKAYDMIKDMNFLDIKGSMDRIRRAITLVTSCAADAYINLQNSGIL